MLVLKHSLSISLKEILRFWQLALATTEKQNLEVSFGRLANQLCCVYSVRCGLVIVLVFWVECKEYSFFRCCNKSNFPGIQGVAGNCFV